jgi:Mrp family chromosome partitioning ATPase
VISDWQLAVEQVVVPATTSGARVLGFTSPTAAAGVTSFSRAVAATLSRSGAEVLYVDLATTLRKNAPAPARAANASAWKDAVVDRATGIQVTGPANLDARFYFNNVRWLRSEFVRMLRTYSNIVVDIAPLLTDDPHRINALAAASACDAVAMICVRSALTQQDLARALQMTASTGVNLMGNILNEKSYTPPGEEIAAYIRRWCPSTKLGHYLSDKLEGSELLH